MLGVALLVTAIALYEYDRVLEQEREERAPTVDEMQQRPDCV